MYFSTVMFRLVGRRRIPDQKNATIMNALVDKSLIREAFSAEAVLSVT